MVFWPFLGNSLRLRRVPLCAPFIVFCIVFSSLFFTPGFSALAQEQLALNADQVVYRRASDEIEALGRVDITYQGNNLAADRVIYNRTTGRVVAIGNITLTDDTDTVVTAQRLDVTDDFQQGFVEAVEFRNPEYGQFLAERGERESALRTRFDNAAYNPCRICEANPDKPLLWNIKAKTIVLDGERKVVTYEDATFQLFGKPIATVPHFRHVDPRENRGSGFLRPKIGYSDDLGVSAGIPYFLVTSPTSDVTFTGIAYSKQGFLGDVEWRQAVGPGYFTLRGAGNYQFSPTSIAPGSVDRGKRARGLIATTGHFKPGDKWAFDWNIVAQSDRTFARTYDIDGYSDRIIRNSIALTGIDNRSFFQIGAKQYLVQDSTPAQSQQAFVLPESSREKVFETQSFGDFKITRRSAGLIRKTEDADAL